MIRGYASLAALAVVVLAGPGVGHAADGEGNYAVRGAGTQACSSLVQAVEEQGPALQAFASWIDGYMSAQNRTGEETFDVSPVAGTGPMVGVVRNICQGNPDASVETAAARALGLLAPYRVDRRSSVIELSIGGRTTEVRRATLALVQRRLAEEGYYDGEADGEYDSASRRAIRQYQRERDLPDSGLPDADTILWLIRDAEQASGG